MKIINVQDQEEQSQIFIDFLKDFQGKPYLMMLSGGKSPRFLYKRLAKERDFPFPKDIALSDERWDIDVFHKNSNALMIKNTGLIKRAESENCNWHPILTGIETPDAEAARYEHVLKNLFAKYKENVVTIMGIGMDLHTSGVLPGSVGVYAGNLVVSYESKDLYKSRITTTLSFIENYLKNVFIFLNGKTKCDRFNDVIHNSGAKDVDYPALVYKEMDKVNILCIYQ